MIRLCTDLDLPEIAAIINDGAQAYQDVIPADRFAKPYMPLEKLGHEIRSGVVFSGYQQAGSLVAVMGLQQVADVLLIRHAYVRTASQGRGLGGLLLAHLRSRADRPLLVGTWADALWAIRFYQRHGFNLVDPATKNQLLRTYWTVPDRQIATSVVLADTAWFAR